MVGVFARIRMPGGDAHNLFRLPLGPPTMWRRLWDSVVEKFGVAHFRWTSKTLRLPHGEELLKGLGERWDDFLQHVEWKLRVSGMISFWHNASCMVRGTGVETVLSSHLWSDLTELAGRATRMKIFYVQRFFLVSNAWGWGGTNQWW